ncbi:LysR substrate-binding domain-containing protein [Sphingomonas sp. CFBP 13733]|uniref:LysR substrate-binding domain-containing protein n=1 Tax=Sphingomonas sp. CFBP 13733 TaxID=2775291 RepID=UPI001783C0F3|nr:LysR substrate-binding domain-containing protein [Sphingomonas sp. CFBP 13733]MBD8641570.1 LysR family transcriptional regulator [Sphingomonas sp. CFBP 13733]
MIAPRRFLPSISSLLALEAVDRLGQATAAAEELSLTHSAVSRQLKVLEEQIGVLLTIRQGRGLVLTPAGTDYAAAVRECLNDLAKASLKIRANGERSSVRLGVLPAFAAHWLTPRLSAFNRRHPDMVVHFSTQLAPFNFNTEKFDAAIHYGEQEWQGVRYLQLTEESVVAVCSPTLAKRITGEAASLLDLPLLHLESRPGAWEEWFEHRGCDARNLRGMLFDQYFTMAQASAAGLGLGLLPTFVAEAEVRSGRLAIVPDSAMASKGRYFLVWPEAVQPSKALQAFINWLRTVV